jgi:3-isopropylmalate/(R)-2-methylmalate dehydratase small subunit
MSDARLNGPTTHFEPITSRVVLLPVNDIDTDQIIPARFLKVTGKNGLGEHLFADWRYDAKGNLRSDFVLNNPACKGATLLLAGGNFGCGSSREHAPWALSAFGFRAVISTSFADIFANNALKNRVLPVAISPEDHRTLLERLTADPAAEVTVNLKEKTVALPGGRSMPFPIDEFARRCLLDGVDELGYLLRFTDRIATFERQA